MRTDVTALTYLLRVTVPDRSLLPLGYSKLREIGWTVDGIYVPATTHEQICPTHGTALEPIPDAGLVCPRCREVNDAPA